MTIQGIIQNGVVVLDGGAALPEGTPVTVLVEQRQTAAPASQEGLMTEEQHRELLEALDAIAALPDENPGDTFSGRDHDKVLYGKP